MKLSFAEEYEFTPEWGSDDREPVRAIIRYLTPNEKRECFDIKNGLDMNKLWRLAVVRIENLMVNGKQIKPMDVPTTRGLWSLYSEIVNHVALQEEAILKSKKK